MTEYEYLTISSNMIDYAITTMTFYLTLTSGYLVTAHLTAQKIGLYQKLVLTLLYVAFAIFMCSGTYAYLVSATQVSETHGTGAVSIIYANTSVILMMFGIIASVSYMVICSKR
jgi:hypothetical protein